MQETAMPAKFATLLLTTMSLLAALMFAGLMFVVLMSTGPANAETALKLSLDFIMFGPNSPFVYADEHGYFN
jgi:ABC-type nitrate/sulfonate/bicarbonate transport system substrate-binding protein